MTGTCILAALLPSLGKSPSIMDSGLVARKNWCEKLVTDGNWCAMHGLLFCACGCFLQAGAALMFHEVLARVMAELPEQLAAKDTANYSTNVLNQQAQQQLQRKQAEWACAGQISEAALLVLQCISNLAGGVQATQQQQQQQQILLCFFNQGEAELWCDLLVKLAGQLKSMKACSNELSDLSALVAVIQGNLGI
jgi:hypothetical protein